VWVISSALCLVLTLRGVHSVTSCLVDNHHILHELVKDKCSNWRLTTVYEDIRVLRRSFVHVINMLTQTYYVVFYSLARAAATEYINVTWQGS
jgi:hypothetical protein